MSTANVTTSQLVARVSIEGNSVVVQSAPVAVAVVDVGGTGPQGPKGDPGGASECVAGAAITAGSVVVIAADGLLYPASTSDATHRGRVVGVAQTSALATEVAEYIPAGTVNAPCALAAGSRAWVGATPGQVVAAPLSGALWTQEVGTVNADGLLSVALSVAFERG